jgi:putative peptidoglycan lipid II flippase
VVGLALGHATSYVFSATVCVLVVRRRLGGVDGAAIVHSLARIVPAAALTALAAFATSELFGRLIGTATLVQQILQVGAAVLAGLLVFGVSATIFGIREAADVRAAVLRRLHP